MFVCVFVFVWAFVRIRIITTWGSVSVFTRSPMVHAIIKRGITRLRTIITSVTIIINITRMTSTSLVQITEDMAMQTRRDHLWARLGCSDAHARRVQARAALTCVARRGPGASCGESCVPPSRRAHPAGGGGRRGARRGPAVGVLVGAGPRAHDHGRRQP